MPKPLPIVKEIIDFAEAHRVPEGKLVGQPLKMMDFQITWLDMTFQPEVDTSIMTIARRNTKTSSAAIVMAAGLYGPISMQNSLLLSASRSKEQAALIYRYLMAMARSSGFAYQLSPRDSLKEVECVRTGVTYKALSADAPTQHGKSARILISDELGQVRGERDELYETLSSGQGSYDDAKHIIISTRAPSDNDLLNILIDEANEPGNPSSVVMEFSADVELEIDDPKAWEQANPALKYGVVSTKDLASAAAKAKRIPSLEASFRNLRLNQKIDTNSPFITPSVWKTGNRSINEKLFETLPVYGGLDLSARRDVTGLVLAVEDPDTQEVHVKPFCWIPQENLHDKAKVDRVPYDVWVKRGFLNTVPGNSIHYDHLATQIADILTQYNVMAVNFDRWRIDQLMHEFDEIGFYVPLEPHGQGYKDMNGAVDETESLLLDGKLIHGGHPILTQHVSNIIIDIDPTNARKPNKKKAINKIDLGVAMMMAVAAVKGTSGEMNAGGLYGSEESARYAEV